MKNIKIVSVITAGLVTFSSCSKLDDKIYDAVATESLSSTGGKIDPATALNGVYTGLNDFSDQGGVYALMEHPTDEMMGPTRGTDWDDFGVWRKLHQHTWDPLHQTVLDGWNRLNSNVFRATQVITFAENNEQIKAEASFLRAFFMFHVMDLYGQVPFREATDDPDANPKVFTRSEAFDFIEKDLLYAEEKLPNSTPDRANKGAAEALLAKLYLNKAVYKAAAPSASYTFDKADMDKAIQYANKVTDLGRYSLIGQGKYFDNFSWDNTNLSKELIFDVNNIEGAAKANARNRWRMVLHYSQTPEGWNGFTTLADFYKSFEAGDERRGGAYPGMTDKIGLRVGFLVGQQYGPGNVALKDRSGNPLVFTEDVNLSYATEARGIRVIKYMPKPSADNKVNDDNPGNDYIFLRYADVVLMKAEAIFRGGTDTKGETALGIVNNLRTLRGASALGNVGAPELLAERGRELYWEGWRRNDQIRFGTFNNPVDQRPNASDPTKMLFPIPQRAIDTNPNLTQNPGY
ncbi:MAG: RagB/SusD family nutrient uptake outer membrane protein [Mucilaginibacter polytrichastri]|nr:RagB/SusD family nutrient uptake outer membrane protein [Mucilaginibacter polytrichastri]